MSSKCLLIKEQWAFKKSIIVYYMNTIVLRKCKHDLQIKKLFIGYVPLLLSRLSIIYVDSSNNNDNKKSKFQKLSQKSEKFGEYNGMVTE